MKKINKNEIGKVAWNMFGSICWLYNIKKLAEKEADVDSVDCSEKIKKISHACYKFDYVLMFIFSLICGFAAGKYLVNAFTPEIETDDESDGKEVE